MKILKLIVIALFFSAPVTHADQATENTIKDLLEVTNAKKLVEGMQAQLDAVMNKSIEQALKGKTPTQSQQDAITNMKNKMAALMRSEFSWEKMEVSYMRLYRDTFTEEEMAGMLAFYKTPAGRAVIYKMPVLMQNNMLEMQRMMAGIMPGMQKIQKEFIAELANGSGSGSGSGSGDSK